MTGRRDSSSVGLLYGVDCAPENCSDFGRDVRELSHDLPTTNNVCLELYTVPCISSHFIASTYKAQIL